MKKKYFNSIIYRILHRIKAIEKDTDEYENELNKYNQKLEDIQEWLSLTQWSQKQIDKNTLEKVQNQLLSLNIIENKLKKQKKLNRNKGEMFLFEI